jgi:hypothetical protein
LISVNERNRDIRHVRLIMGAFHMSLSSAIHSMLSKIEEWWKDHEDERLDEIVAFDDRNSSNNASDRGLMAYQLVKSARNSRNTP